MNENIAKEKTLVLNIIWVVFLFGKFILDFQKANIITLCFVIHPYYFSDFDICMFNLGIAIQKKTNQIAT